MLRVAVARVGGASSSQADPPPLWMGGSERARWTVLRPTERPPFVASRALLRHLLQAATGVPADGWDVTAEAGTEPVVRGPAGVRASLSHRLGWVAAAVSDAAVGVDVECVRPARTDARERAALMLMPEELPAWNALAPEQRESGLLTCWTAKEAWFKAAPSQHAVWDFRRVVARACAPARANVRVWVAAPLHVAVCCTDPRELSEADCGGLDATSCTDTFWHVGQA
jgi:4'-phosphopantetheinyl transferase